MGDLNLKVLQQENKELKAILDVFGLKQLVQKPTRISETTETLIEVIFKNNPVNMIENDVTPTSIADHDMVGCVREPNHAHLMPEKLFVVIIGATLLTQ